MVPTTLPIFAGFLITSGPPRVTKVREARALHLNTEPYRSGDHYIHLRRPIREAFLAGGDRQMLVDVLDRLTDPKKQASHAAVLSGLSKFFTKHAFTGGPLKKRIWTHGDLRVSVTPTARILINDQWHVVYVHLKAEPLSGLAVAPILELIQKTHGDLGSPMIVEGRTGKTYRPSTSDRVRRGLGALLDAEADAFVALWNADLEPA